MIHGRIVADNIFELDEFLHHRGKRNVLRADDRAVQPAGVLLREESFRNDDVQIYVQAYGRDRDAQHERLVGKDPAQAAGVAAMQQRRKIRSPNMYARPCFMSFGDFRKPRAHRGRGG